MESRTVEAVIERTSQDFESVGRESSFYGVARLSGEREDSSWLNGSAYVLAKLEGPLRSEVVLEKSLCVPIPQFLGVQDALLAPPLALALSFWDRLHLELGEAAIYTEGDVFADLLGQVAIWSGACPVIKLCNAICKSPLVSGESQLLSDADQALHQLRHRIKEKPGFAAIDLSGRPEIIDLLLEVVPRWGRIMLAGRTRQPLTVDFYNNVHRKGVVLVSSAFEPTYPLQESQSRAYLPAAFRILQNKEMAAICSDLVHRKHSIDP